jgi:omega-amidase
LMFTPTGELAAVYHKQRLFAYANEQRTYVSGERAVVVDIDGVRVSPFICYDLRFPELFRAVAADTDLMVVIASWPAARRAHWDALLRARAIENQCYVIGVNRTGVGDSIVYDGGSAAYDPWGIALDRSVVAHAADVTSVTVSAGEVKRVRGAYPFLADRR